MVLLNLCLIVNEANKYYSGIWDIALRQFIVLLALSWVNDAHSS
jgi:hypothetical protein